MKKFLLFIFITAPLFIFGQTYTTNADIKFQPLNKNYITTHILYDRVYPMAELTDFNQTGADTSQVNHFYNAYAELQTADYNDRWDPITTLQNNVETQWQQDRIAIGIINTDFEVIDEESFQDDLLDFSGTDSLLVDVPGRSRSPYIKRNATVVSPLQEDSNSTTVTFTTGAAFTMQAAPKTISSLQADFSDGQGYQSIPLSGTKTVTFPGAGLYTIKFKINLSNNGTRYTYGKIRINASQHLLRESTVVTRASSGTDCTGGTLYSSIKFQGYDENQSYSGAGEYEVFQGGSAFDRPVIVLDGFDPDEGTDDGIGINYIYTEFLKYDNSNLGTTLRGSKFDIVPLNFLKYRATDGHLINGGTDYVERNAMVLVDLITRLRGCKTGSQPIKVIGFSMGGLVARYALRYMEQNNIPHDTDLFISVDTPHEGAVVPIGLQEMADLIDDITPFGLGDSADDLLQKPAAKQMLVHHYLAHSKKAEGAPNFHDRFYNTLGAMGFPQQTRNISVVDGVSNGAAINAPGQRFVDGELNTGLLYPLIGGRVKAIMNYAPDRGQTRDALNFKIQLKLLFVRLTLFKRIRQASTSTLTGSYENSPGGFYDVESLVEDFLGMDNEFDLFNNDFLSSVILKVKASLTDPNFSFIPVKSSLAYSGNDEDLYEDFSYRNLVCSGETPFDSYFTSESNQNHIKLTSNSANYMKQEIMGIPQSPNIEASDAASIIGSENICGSGTYSVDVPSNTNVTWSVSPSNALSLTQGNPTTTFSTTNGYSGEATITASFINGSNCGTYTLNKNIVVGPPELYPGGGVGSPDQTNPFYLCQTYQNDTRNVVRIYGLGLQTDSQYEFEYVSTNFQAFLSGNKLSIIPYQTGSITFKVRASNDCGWSDWVIYNFPVQDCAGGGGDPYLTVSPNPATNQFSITKTEGAKNNAEITKSRTFNSAKASGEPAEMVTYKIYDFYNNLLQTSETDLDAPIDVSNLDQGLYILKLYWGSITETHQILIE